MRPLNTSSFLFCDVPARQTSFKLFSFVLVFVVAMGGGLVPIRLQGLARRDTALSLGNTLGGGVFLSAGGVVGVCVACWGCIWGNTVAGLYFGSKPPNVD